MIQIRIHNIHISDQTQLAMVNLPSKWHRMYIFKNKLQKVDLLVHLNSFWLYIIALSKDKKIGYKLLKVMKYIIYLLECFQIQLNIKLIH
jgi:hypothetical protein